MTVSNEPSGGSGKGLPPKKRRVRLHPLPDECPPQLAEIIGAAAAGAISSALDAHPCGLSKVQQGLLHGSIRKRLVNQLCCKETRERLAAELSRGGD